MAPDNPLKHPLEHPLGRALRLSDKLIDPDKPYVLRFLFACFLFCYAAGFIWNSAIFSAAFGCGFLLWDRWEDYDKRRSDRRRAQYKAAMDEWERQYRELWTTARRTTRISALITPDWML